MYVDDTVSLEIKNNALSKLLLSESLIDTDEDRTQRIETVTNHVLSCLHGNLSETPFGRLLRKKLSSAGRDFSIDIEIDGELKSILFPKIEYVEVNKAIEKGIFLIDWISKTKPKCVLICCKSRSEIDATLGMEGDSRAKLELGFKKYRYAQISGTSIFDGRKRRKDSFVVKECVSLFSETEYAEISSSKKLHEYFSVYDERGNSLDLRFEPRC